MTSDAAQQYAEHRMRCRELKTLLDHDGAIASADVIGPGEGWHAPGWTVEVIVREEHSGVPSTTLATIADWGFELHPEPPQGNHTLVTLLPER